jgi:outer membrane protein OmpA-like peptidoglycan-associated protein
MNRISAFLIAIGLSIPAGASVAQSVLTLDSFDLEESATDATSALSAANENCLVNPDQEVCKSGVRGSSQAFSLNDVVNLGIIERSEVEVADVEGQVVRVEDRVEPLPSIDLEILFDYNSAVLRTDQMAPLIALSRDLSTIDFMRAQLVLMGHTDGVGSAFYNKDLSHRRAQSVAVFLSEAAGIPLHRIRTSGMGFDYLKAPYDPASAVNRRVQILLVE